MAESAEMWTVAQIAAHIGRTWRRSYDLLLSGKFGPPQQRGRAWLGQADRVREYVEKQHASHV